MKVVSNGKVFMVDVGKYFHLLLLFSKLTFSTPNNLPGALNFWDNLYPFATLEKLQLAAEERRN